MEYQEVTPGAPREVPGGPREPNVVRGVAPARIYLQPIASPWILGLMSLGAISFAIGAHWAGWYGRAVTPTLVFPFILLGGLIQLLAGMWAFRARDTIGTVALTTWGSFFLGYGVLNWLFATGVFPAVSFRELGMVFFVVGALTLATAIAAAAENLALMVTLLGFTLSAALLGIGEQLQNTTWIHVGGWVIWASSLAAYYTAGALLLESAFNRVVLPVGRVFHKMEEYAVDTGVGEPGVVRHTHPGLQYTEPPTAQPGPSGPAVAQA